MERRAKIVATVGPATHAPELLRALAAAGVDVFRLNFSHGELPTHGDTIRTLRALRLETGASFAILQDLPGPKVRVGRLENGAVTLMPGAEIELSSDAALVGNGTRISVNYPWLAEDVTPGQRVLLDDGRLEMIVESRDGATLRARVLRGGLLTERKGVNLPGAGLRWPAMTERDATALQFGLAAGVDIVAMSFVRSGEDAAPARRMIRAARKQVPLIAKIEKPQALDHLDSVLRKFDGVMVARGDLGVELAPEQVPMAQKRIIAAARTLGRPVITATQMLESMTGSPRPTRAEASDVANAILDGTDAVMLSAETSVGSYPIQAVETMHRIIVAAEAGVHRALDIAARHTDSDADAVAHAAAVLSRDVQARVIAVVTRSGRTAKLVTEDRPAAPVVAYTDSAEVQYQLALWWGVRSRHLALGGWVEMLIPEIERDLLQQGMVVAGDKIVVVGATPIAAAQRTNFIKIHPIRG